MSRLKISSFDWFFWFQWLMSTAVGWILGRFLLPNLAFVTIGIGLGIFQWLVLQNRIRNAWRWIIATSIGWLIGSSITMFLLPAGMDFIAGTIIGIGLGFAQWLILRYEYQWAGWWIMINVVAWTTGMALLPGILLTGVMAGVITGLAMELLSRTPVREHP